MRDDLPFGQRYYRNNRHERIKKDSSDVSYPLNGQRWRSTMRVSFACPSCNAAATVDAIHVGKHVRCKHCGTHFAIPDGETSEPDVYALEESADPAARAIPETQAPVRSSYQRVETMRQRWAGQEGRGRLPQG